LRERERERERACERERKRETERQRQRKREKEKEPEREREAHAFCTSQKKLTDVSHFSFLSPPIRSSSLHATTVLRLEHLMKEHKASWLFQFSKYDKEDSGSIYVDEFQIVLEKMEMGVSKKQLQEIMRSASGNGEKVNYLAFVDKYGGLTDTEVLT
jgi:hypothetical protein